MGASQLAQKPTVHDPGTLEIPAFNTTRMISMIQDQGRLPTRDPYQLPKLETLATFPATIGVSLPIGGSITASDEEESL
jgi:hypothetical protein